MDSISDMNIPKPWQAALKKQGELGYLYQLLSLIKHEKALGKKIFPEEADYFRSLELTPPQNVRVVILGQDPYHRQGQAHGLSFSVPHGVKIPPSLVNIYKELHSDLGIKPATHGNLEAWAKQGVLLLNSVFTVEEGLANSHKNKGWECFSDAVIEVVNQGSSSGVFMLWGAYAQKKAQLIDDQKHLVLKSAHPSPLSAYNGFYGCQHFSKANHWLVAQGRGSIDWHL